VPLPRQQVAASGSVRRLFVIYALVSLVPVLLLGAWLLVLNHGDASSRALAEGASEARLVSQTAIAPQLDGHPLDRPMTASERDGLSRTVDLALHTGHVFRLRVRDLSGRVVFSVDGAGQGSIDDEALEAAGGETVAHLTWLNSDAGDVGSRGPRVVEAYTPLVAAQSSRPLGVVEVYLPYAPIAADIRHGETRLALSLSVGLLVLWLALLGVSLSVTRRMHRQSEDNAYLALHDTLTGMPNRTRFQERAAAAIAVATDGRPAAIAVIDLDRFKQINDTLGHANGDRLLVALAERITGCIRDGDTIARLGGDEFGVVLSGVHGASEAVEVFSRLRTALAAPLVLDGLPLAVEASVGFALAPCDGTDIGTLLTRADVAMYVAKRQHHGVVHFHPDHDEYDAAALALVGELGEAIRTGQLFLHFQPKLDVRAGRFRAVEALVRWQHPTRGVLYPGAFLPAVEQTELVEPLTEWVLREALAALPTLDPSGEIAVAVNISARSLARDDFAGDVLAILAAAGVDPGRVILEVTETALLTDPPRAAETLKALDSAGVRISIDDFGAGQTSLGYLATLPISELKIDKAFVLPMCSDPRNAAIVRSVIELGHSLGFTVTAEGVETQQVLDGLIAADCDLIQGFFLGKPVDVQTARAVLAQPLGSSAG
jgi:diguanylate cyclase